MAGARAPGALRTGRPGPSRTRRPSRPAPRRRAPTSSSPAGASLAVWLTGVLATLCCVGLVMVGSASSVVSIAYYGSAWAIALRECLWLLVGVAVFVVVSRWEPERLGKLSALLALGSLALLVLVLVPGVGISAFGASRWIGAGMLRVQPSEVAKLALCLYVAQVISTRERVETEWFAVLRPVALAAALFAGLVLVQPDMGTAVVLVAIAFAVVTVAGAPKRALLTGLAALGALALVAALASPYRRARMLGFLDPQLHSSGSGYQLIQSKIGFGTGQLFGLGLGNSREKWGLLPNPHTDFIFSVIGEELGLLGALLVLGLLIALVLLGLRVARVAPDRFSQLAAVGISVWLAAETIVNVGAVIGLLPVTGIPLPFVSFGGTSLVIDMAAVGVLVGIARRAQDRGPSLRVVREPARTTTPRRAAQPRPHGHREPRRR